MKRLSIRADRLSDFSLGLLCLSHWLFLLALLLAAFLAVPPAHAETACTGKNLLAELQARDPKTLAAIRAEASRALNGQGTLWRIEKPGTAPSFLLGTMHVADPRVLTLSPEAQTAFDGAKTLVIETTDVLDQARMMAALLSEPDLTMFTDGTTLASHLSRDDAAVLDKGLEARGIPPASVAKMKPWILSAVVGLPACELARKAGGADVLDIRLARAAQAAGKAVLGLESAVEQMRAMASLPMKFHLAGLVDTLKLGGKIDDIVETMVVIYESGETGLFWPLFRAELPDSDGGAGYAAFENTMITARNRGMADKAAPILDRGGAFLAVGALHLPGPDGLVALLGAKGFSLTPME